VKQHLSPLAGAVLLGVPALVALLAYGVLSNDPSRDIDESVAVGKPYRAPELEPPRLEGEGRASLSTTTTT